MEGNFDSLKHQGEDDDFKKVKEESPQQFSKDQDEDNNYKKSSQKQKAINDEDEQNISAKEENSISKHNFKRRDSQFSFDQDNEKKDVQRKEIEAQVKTKMEQDDKLNKPQIKDDGTKVYTAKDDFYLAQQNLLKLFNKRVQKQPKRFEDKRGGKSLQKQEELLFNSEIDHPYLEFMKDNYKKTEYETKYSRNLIKRVYQDSKSKAYAIVQYQRLIKSYSSVKAEKNGNLSWGQIEEIQNLPKNGIINLQIQFKSEKDNEFSEKFNGYIDNTYLYDRINIFNDCAYFFTKNCQDKNILRLELQKIELGEKIQTQDMQKYTIEIKNIPDVYDCDFCFIDSLLSANSQELDEKYLFIQTKKAFFIYSLKDTEKPFIEKQFETEKEIKDMILDSYFIKMENNSTIFVLNSRDASCEITFTEQRGDQKENQIEIKEFKKKEEKNDDANSDYNGEKGQSQDFAIDLTNFQNPKVKIYSSNMEQPQFLFDGFYFQKESIIYDDYLNDNEKLIVNIENIFQENEIHSYNVNRHRQNVYSGRNIGIVGNEIFIFSRNFLLLDFSDSGQFFVINLLKNQKIDENNYEQ